MEVRDLNRKLATSPCRDYYKNGNSGGARNGRLFSCWDLDAGLRTRHITTRVDSSLSRALRTQFGQNLVPIVERSEE